MNFRLNLLKLLFTYKKVAILSLILMLAVTGLNLINPLIMKTLVDEAIPAKDVDLLMLCLAGIVLIPVVTTLFSSIDSICKEDMGTRISSTLREQLTEKLLRLSPKTSYQYKQGEITNLLTTVSHRIGEIYIRYYLLPSFNEAVKLVGITFFIFWLNMELALVSFALLPFFLVTVYFGYYRKKEIHKEMSEFRRDYDSYLTELVGGIKTVQMFQKEEQELSRGRRFGERYRELRGKIQRQRSLFQNIYKSLNDSLSLGILFAYGIWLIFQEKLSLGELIAFTVYHPHLSMAVDRLFDLYMETTTLKPDLDRYEQIMNLPEENVDAPDAIEANEIKGEIAFCNVSFRYQEERPILKGVSFTISPGEFIGIVGPTGGGKSTILDLLLRFDRPEEGTILLDGIPIEQYSLSSYRRLFGMVPQDLFLWNRSLKENLTWVASDVSEEELYNVLEQALLSELITRLPEGWNTTIGDRGVRLSGGEKQRLGIARALLNKPQILLLDEPTSALDAVTEAQIQSELEKLFVGKTVIVVAHRLATIRRADRILVVVDGRIVEEGTHEQLMKLKGVYYQLYMEQMASAHMLVDG